MVGPHLAVPAIVKVTDQHRGLLLRRRRPRRKRNVGKVYETRVAAVKAVERRPQVCLVELPLLDRSRQELVEVDASCDNKINTKCILQSYIYVSKEKRKNKEQEESSTPRTKHILRTHSEYMQCINPNRVIRPFQSKPITTKKNMHKYCLLYIRGATCTQKKIFGTMICTMISYW